MWRSKLTINWQLPIGLKKFLAPIFAYGGIGLVVLSLVAISITSGAIAIEIIIGSLTGKGWSPMIGTMAKALGVEIVILVIAAVMVPFGVAWVWLP
jgi:hypothetical protein